MLISSMFLLGLAVFFWGSHRIFNFVVKACSDGVKSDASKESETV